MEEKKKIKLNIYNLSPLLRLFSIYTLIIISSEIILNLRNLLDEYEITMIIKGNGTQQILNNKQVQIYDSISNRNKNYIFG